MDAEQRSAKKPLPIDSAKWPLEVQIAVFNGILHYKPVGYDASFNMASLLNFIYESAGINLMSTSENESDNFQPQNPNLSSLASFLNEYHLTSGDVWNFLYTVYDLEALVQNELPHPQLKADMFDPTQKPDTEMQIEDFSLPETEFGQLIRAKPEVVIAEHNSSKQNKKSAKNQRRSTTGVDETESLPSSRSSTPISSAGGASTLSTPLSTRRSRQNKD